MNFFSLIPENRTFSYFQIICPKIISRKKNQEFHGREIHFAYFISQYSKFWISILPNSSQWGNRVTRGNNIQFWHLIKVTYNSRKTPCFGRCLFVDFKQFLHIAAGIWLLKVNNQNTTTKCLTRFNVNTKDTKTMLMTSVWCLHY